MSGRVSICIPAYNQPDALRRALESIRIQTLQDYEVVITDDSTDEAVSQAVEGYLADSRFRYIRNTEAKGTPGNWNEAIRHARNPLIKLLHHDDWFTDEQSLAEFVRLMEADLAVDFAFSAANACDARGNLQWIHAPAGGELARLAADPLCLIWGNFVGAPSVTIFRKNSAPAFDENMKWLVDLDFYIAVLRKNPRFAYADRPLVSVSYGEHQVSEAYRRSALMQLKEHVYLRRKLGAEVVGPAHTWKYITQASRLVANCAPGELAQCDFVRHPQPSLRIALLLGRNRARARRARRFLASFGTGR